MKWFLDAYPQVVIVIAVIVPFIFWTYIGLVGRFDDIPREAWLRAGFVGTLLMILFVLYYVLSAIIIGY